MKKSTFLLAGGFVAALISCKKSDSEAVVDGRCVECLTEEYKSPTGSLGESKKGYFDGRDIEYMHIDGHNVLEGDIILTDEQLNLNGKGTITTTSSKIWTNKRVYYVFASGLDQATKDKFNTAKAHWESKTNIRFYLRTTQANYINVIKGTGCYSSIGMVGGKQDLSLASGCSSGNAIHEIGHAIGLWHEHTRTYRNNYVTINYGNIQSGKSGNFNICSSCTSNGTLDYGSIMMYDSYAFSSNGLPTIVKLNGSTFTSQRNALSTNDISIVASKY